MFVLLAAFRLLVTESYLVFINHATNQWHDVSIVRIYLTEAGCWVFQALFNRAWVRIKLLLKGF